MSMASGGAARKRERMHNPARGGTGVILSWALAAGVLFLQSETSAQTTWLDLGGTIISLSPEKLKKSKAQQTIKMTLPIVRSWNSSRDYAWTVVEPTDKRTNILPTGYSIIRGGNNERSNTRTVNFTLTQATINNSGIVILLGNQSPLCPARISLWTVGSAGGAEDSIEPKHACGVIEASGIGNQGTTWWCWALRRYPHAARRVDASSDNGDISVVPAALTFSGTSWNMAQTATAEQVADARNDPATISHSIGTACAASAYSVEFYIDYVSVTMQDNHGLIVSPQAVTVVAKGALAVLTSTAPRLRLRMPMSPPDKIAMVSTTVYGVPAVLPSRTVVAPWHHPQPSFVTATPNVIATGSSRPRCAPHPPARHRLRRQILVVRRP